MNTLARRHKLLALLLLALLASVGAVTLAVSSSGGRALAQDAEVLSTIELRGTVRKLGSKELASKQPMYALWEANDAWVRQRFDTTAEGTYSLKVPRASTVRFYGTGEWMVPVSWASVTLPAAQDSPQTHDVWLRPMALIRVSGTLKRPNGGEVSGSQVVLAPLDELADGSLLPVSPPFQFNVGSSGEWSVQVPAGRYDAWALWSDRNTDDWRRHYAQSRRIEIYADAKLSLTLTEQPRIRGTVVDASKDNQPIDATVELYTHAYLRQMRIFTGDVDSEGNVRPTGVFDDQFNTLDINDFVMVVNPSNLRDAVRVIPGMSATKFAAAPVIRLRDPANGKLSLTYTTKDRGIPLAQTIQIQPISGIKAPPFVHQHLTLKAQADTAGKLDFWGLPTGRYALYAEEGGWLLGELDVTGGVQSHAVFFDAPFAVGTITFPDQALCTHAKAWVMMPKEGGGEGVVAVEVFENPSLKAKNTFYLPLFFVEGPCEIIFAAPAPGTELAWNDTPDNLPFVSEPIKLESLKKGALDLPIALKPR